MVLHARVANDQSDDRGDLGTAPNLLERRFGQISLRHDAEDGIIWCYMDQKGRPSYTYELGAEIQEVHDWIARCAKPGASPELSGMRYFVGASKTPGIFNLGGDLRHFAANIRNRDLPAMRAYAETCTRMQYSHATGFGAPIITMALVQGDALGGGFEHALAFDLLVAERSARLGLPEIIFNLFPGMGAYSFLLRRVGRKMTEEFILGGKIYGAEELYDMGIVDILAEDGEGEATVIDYTRRNRSRFHAERAVYSARKASHPVSLDELLEITNIWAETAMHLTDADVRKMERLADAQERRIAKRMPRPV
ncbi:crotonase/enoyl-CoA hydratase family protein [Novosphingopyxis sp. YJ-S2-01]|uniref:crotonase/enoyl-CoA hydratase family protein n=1 Tax=Novosphingopyxis sp. YJ-S2-01 TaxID=2794021 RepID=UPI0018DE53AE|nr:crotonase/enoyl-CoA hydratase family protein [Novosphingopyxis sp. YJ-S2-01]MBH9538203.1 crotonase/enoyl-CoA hydratase family protein [Novosphingopyxis sp. YJ-S2-01]